MIAKVSDLQQSHICDEDVGKGTNVGLRIGASGYQVTVCALDVNSGTGTSEPVHRRAGSISGLDEKFASNRSSAVLVQTPVSTPPHPHASM
jgi:hypothetical protein